MEVQWLRLHASNAGGVREQGEGEKEKKKKMVQLKKKKELPLAMGTVCSGLCLGDSRESLVAGSGVQGWC